MNRIPEDNPMKKTGPDQPPSTTDELDGLVGMGMKREALKEARRRLKKSPMTAATFSSAVDAILMLGDRLKTWKSVVESAYERLAKRDRSKARFSIMSFRWAGWDYEGVLRLMPERTGDFFLIELVYLTEAALALHKKALVTKLARKLPGAIQCAENPQMQASLLLCLSECHAREGQWEKAIAAAEVALSCETLSRNAVVQIVEIHVAGALRALHTGFQFIQQFKRNFDPKTETMLPGNDDVVQEKAAKEFRRLRKILERIMPKKRQKELGIDPND